MTPREPDRFEEKAREILRQDAIDVIRSHVAPPLADLMIRALASPAAAPAAETRKRTREEWTALADEERRGTKQGLAFLDAVERDGCMAKAPPSEPAAPARDFFAGHSDAEVQAALDEVRGKSAPPAPDPCQRCGKLGGHVVVFRFDRISTAKWICPHCLDAQEKRLEAQEALLRECREWLAAEAREPGDAPCHAWVMRDRIDKVIAAPHAKGEGTP